MNKFLVTGVAGLIGSHIADELLKKGYSVVGIDNFMYGTIDNIAHNIKNDKFTFVEGDVCDLDVLMDVSNGCDGIFHMAAVKKVGEHQSAFDTLKVNTLGTENVLKVAKEKDAKLVFASTSDVYGMSPDLPFREDGDLLLGPSYYRRWSYSVSKLFDEHNAFTYAKDFGVKLVVLRYFGTFSPRSSFLWSGGHIPIFINKILNDELISVHGDGTQTRSMAHVSDVVRGTIAAMESKEAEGEIINIGSEEEMSIVDTAYLIHEMMETGKELKIEFVPFDEIFGKGYKDIMKRRPDLSKAKRILGYEPTIKFKDAIQMTIDTVKGKATHE